MIRASLTHFLLQGVKELIITDGNVKSVECLQATVARLPSAAQSKVTTQVLDWCQPSHYVHLKGSWVTAHPLSLLNLMVVT